MLNSKKTAINNSKIDLENLLDRQQKLYDSTTAKQLSMKYLSTTLISSGEGGVHRIIELSVGDDGVIQHKYWKVAEFKSFYGDRYYHTSDNSTFNPYHYWLNYPGKVRVEKIVFNPDPNFKPAKQVMNLWQGYPEHAAVGMNDNAKLILDHVQKYLCSGSEDNFFYLLAWVAQMIQEAHIKTGVAVILKSKKKGVGKGTFFKLIGKLLGQHNVTLVQDPEQLLGKHNTKIENKILVGLDEVPLRGSEKYEAKLRSLITEDKITIEPKGVDSKTVDCHIRILGMTNVEDPVSLDTEERRFFILEITFDLKGKEKREYFDRLYDAIDDDVAISQIFNYLKGYDITPFNLREAPMTDASCSILTKQQTNEDNWLLDTLIQGDIGTVKLNASGSTRIPNATLLAAYQDYCRENGVKASNLKGLTDYLIDEVGVQRYKTKDTRGIETPSLESMRESYRASHPHLVYAHDKNNPPQNTNQAA